MDRTRLAFHLLTKTFKPMKTCNVLRKRLLMLLGISAMVLAGSCSKDAAVEPDATRAGLEPIGLPEFSFYCEPAAKGTNESYLALTETYRFNCVSFIRMPYPHLTTLVPCKLTIHASDGSTDGFDFVDGEPSGNFEHPLYVKFTKPGYYDLTAETEIGGNFNQKTRTYCVVSNVSGITLPDTIELGVPFDFSFEFSDPRYPSPTIEIRETLFNDPQCTVLDNDYQGNFRLRFDQPGEYSISTGLEGIFRARADIKLYWRPEKLGSESTPFKFSAAGARYLNHISLCDANDEVYTSLPYGVYFEYVTNELFPEGEPEPRLSGTKILSAGENGKILMPVTGKEVFSAVKNWVSYPRHPSNLHWDLMIPDDEKKWFRAVYIHDIDCPENPGGETYPLDHSAEGTIIR